MTAEGHGTRRQVIVIAALFGLGMFVLGVLTTLGWVAAWSMIQ